MSTFFFQSLTSRNSSSWSFLLFGSNGQGRLWIGYMFLWTEFLSASMYFSEFLKCISLSFWNVFLSASEMYFSQLLKCISLSFSAVFLSICVISFNSIPHRNCIYLTFSKAFLCQLSTVLPSYFLNCTSLSVNQLYLLGYWEWMMAASRQIILVLRCWNTLEFFSLLVSWLDFSQFLNCISFSFSTVFLSVF